MSILVNKNTKVIVQGITGREGLFHSRQMLAYGTNIVAGVTPGKGGDVIEGDIPVYDSCRNVIKDHNIDCSVIYVPARFAAEAIIEAAECGIELIVCITEGVPVSDMMEVRSYIDSVGSRLIGPNCPGILTPGQTKIGIIPGHIAKPGNVGVVSRSGTLTYEVLYALKQHELGATTCVGIGGDPVNGTNFIDVIELFQDDDQTQQIVMIGEIGGSAEEEAADYILDNVDKPVVAFIAGQTAPPGKRMGHAGAIVEGGSGKASDKIDALKVSGVYIANHPEEIPMMLLNNINGDQN
tara:strand:+ start:3428 stop:4312 length:885 start_codon:yes stop_codon:yes gene_type:complete